MHHVHIESISVPYKLSLFPKPLVPPVIRMPSEIPGNSIGRCVTQPANITATRSPGFELATLRFKAQPCHY